MNRFERDIAIQLAVRQKQIVYSFTYAFEDSRINYVRPEPQRVYTPDFTIVRANGSQLYIETKGYFRAEHRTKMRHVKRCNPNLDIRIIFQKNLMINKKTGFSYCKWAKKNSFPCAVGTIPKEWLE